MIEALCQFEKNTVVFTHFIVINVAAGAAALAFAVKTLTHNVSPLISGLLVLAVYGIAFFGSAAAAGFPDALRLFGYIRALPGGKGR